MAFATNVPWIINDQGSDLYKSLYCKLNTHWISCMYLLPFFLLFSMSLCACLRLVLHPCTKVPPLPLARGIT